MSTLEWLTRCRILPVGFCKWFDTKRGYGFITVENDEEEEVFVHFSNIDMEGYKKLEIGDKVGFEIKESDGKGLEAIKVKVISKDRRY